jgi:hypothetical protein
MHMKCVFHLMESYLSILAVGGSVPQTPAVVALQAALPAIVLLDADVVPVRPLALVADPPAPIVVVHSLSVRVAAEFVHDASRIISAASEHRRPNHRPSRLELMLEETRDALRLLANIIPPNSLAEQPVRLDSIVPLCAPEHCSEVVRTPRQLVMTAFSEHPLQSFLLQVRERCLGDQPPLMDQQTLDVVATLTKLAYKPLHLMKVVDSVGVSIKFLVGTLRRRVVGERRTCLCGEICHRPYE